MLLLLGSIVLICLCTLNTLETCLWHLVHTTERIPAAHSLNVSHIFEVKIVFCPSKHVWTQQNRKANMWHFCPLFANTHLFV